MGGKREEVVRALVHVLTSGKERYLRNDSQSEADIVASKYMQRVMKGQKRCAQELQGTAFEG